MKHLSLDVISSKFFLVAAVVIWLSALSVAQNVGISNDGLPPDPSAILDIRSGEGGVLIPRTDTQSILSPAHGLMIYDTLDQSFYYFKMDHWVRFLDESQMFFLFADRDGDGYGDKYSAIYTAESLFGYVADSTDCDDTNPLIFPSNPDICDGIDNDCDPATLDGSANPLLGCPCDGPDSDLCEEGIWVCDGSDVICNDDTGDNLELCDGIDNDCNPMTNDGDDEPVGLPCDGPDSDLCEEGITSCTNGMLDCSDDTGDDVEICGNLLDDDCDGMSDEDCACGPDGTTALAQCGTGGCGTQIIVCVGGTWTYPNPCEYPDEICGNGIDDDCDGMIDEPGCI